MKTKSGLDIWSDYKKVTGVNVLIPEGLEELPGGRPLEPKHGRNVPT